MKGGAYPRYDDKQGDGSETPCLIAIIEFCPFDNILWCAWVSNQNS